MTRTIISAGPGFNLRALPAFVSAKAFPGAITFISVPIFLSLFGANAYGSYARAWAIASVCSALGVGWIRQAYLRESPDLGDSLTVVPRHIELAVSIAAGILSIGANLASGAGWSVGISALTYTSCFSFNTIQLTSAQALQSNWMYNLAEILRSAFTVILALLAALIMPHSGAAILYSAAAACMIGSAVLQKAIGGHTLLASGHDLSAYLSYGLPMSIWSALATCVLYTDRFAVSVFCTARVAGQYAALSDLAVRGVAMVAFPIVMASHPQIMATFNSGNVQGSIEAITKWTRLLSIVLAGVIICALVLSPYVVGSLGTLPGYRWITTLLIFSSGMWQLALLSHKLHELARKTRRMLMWITVSAFVAAILSLALTPTVGAPGAAIGTAAGASMYVFLIRTDRKQIRDLA